MGCAQGLEKENILDEAFPRECLPKVIGVTLSEYSTIKNKTV
jgi:hypothetical protein